MLTTISVDMLGATARTPVWARDRDFQALEGEVPELVSSPVGETKNWVWALPALKPNDTAAARRGRRGIAIGIGGSRGLSQEFGAFGVGIFNLMLKFSPRTVHCSVLSCGAVTAQW
jgi:hypothetical protein